MAKKQKKKLGKFMAGAAAFWPAWLLEGLWLAVIFLLPLFFWPFSYTSFELPKVVLFRTLVLAMTVCWMIKLGREESVAVPLLKRSRWLLILFGMMIAGWILSTIFSAAPAVSFFGMYPRFQGLFTWLTYLLFAVIVFFNVQRPEQFGRIFKTVFASTILVCVVALIQRAGLDWLNYWDVSSFLGRVFGTMGHPDYLAGFLIMVIPLAVSRLLVSKDYVLGSLTMVLGLSALYFSLSRGAFLGLFVGMLVFLLVYFKKQQRRKLLWLTLALPLWVFIIFAIIQVNDQSSVVQENTLLQRMVLQGENARSIDTRLALWPASLQLIGSRPWLGHGLDTFVITFPQYSPQELNVLENFGDVPDRAHNMLLDYAAQFGVPALLIFLSLVILFFARILQNIFADEKSDKVELWVVPLGLLSALTAILVANQFSFFVTVQWVYFWLFAVLLLRMLAVKNARKAWLMKEQKFLKAVIILVVLTLGLGSLWRDVALVRADLVYREILQKQNSEAMQSLLPLAHRAVALAPYYSFYSEQEANIGLLAAQEATEPTIRLKLFEQAEAALERMGALENHHGKYFYLKGKILSEKARLVDKKLYGQAYFAFEKGIKQLANHPFVYLEYGRALLADGMYAKAAENFEKYLALSPPYYQWKNDLTTRSFEDQERYRIFYKLHPDFNAIFSLIFEAYSKAGNLQKAEEYRQYLYF